MNTATCLIPVLLLAALGSSCTTPSAPTKVALDVPDRWQSPVMMPRADLVAPWTVALSDPQLERLIAEALAHNTDLILAAERVEILRAQYRIQKADRLPTLGAGLSLDRAGTPAANGQTVTTETWTAGLSVPAWEIDLWGRVQNLSAAARSRFLAAEHNRRAVRLSLIAEVSNAYFGLASYDEQLEIARATLASRIQSRKLVEQRKLSGLASGLDLQLAESLVANAEQSLTEIARLRARQENALAVLVGRGPGQITRAEVPFQLEFPALVPAGLPAELLARRPDVLAAEEQLRAADLDVTAARKLFLPTLSLTGFAGYISPQFSDLMKSGNEAWSLTPAAAIPLFNGGRLRANLAISQAQQRSAAATYSATVRNAFRDVEDALNDYQSYLEQRAALARAVQAAKHRLALTLDRYSVGASPYLDVLDSFRELFNAALAHSQATRASYASVVQIYRALGGGWEAPTWEVKPTVAATDGR